MIPPLLPTKHVPADATLLGIGGVVLARLSRPATVTDAWERVRDLPGVGSFANFTIALDLLYAMGLIELRDGALHRAPT